MTRVQIVVGSRHGGTAGIADRIAEVLRGEGIATTVARAEDRPDVAGYDAHIVGSGVYMGSWLREAVTFLEDNQLILAGRPVWLFSSGPIPNSSKTKPDADPLTNALGPTEGPGSGGHRRVNAVSDIIGPRGHVVFDGRFDPDDSPKNIAERVVRLIPAIKDVLPAGDFRPWTEIEAWAHEIARELEPVPVGS